jgi:hypothetical protein
MQDTEWYKVESEQFSWSAIVQKVKDIYNIYEVLLDLLS